MIKNYTKALMLFSLLITISIISCKRESIIENPIDPIIPPTTAITAVNDFTQVTASVSGIVLDESNAPIPNAVVTSGAATTTTNSNGMFIFQNISLSKENGSVTVVKAGYFKGIRSFKTTAGKNHTVRLQLMQKVLSGTVSAAAGGTINSNGGAIIIFPAAAFVTSTGAAYTGTVNVYSRWINPTAANLPFIIPGDLRGVGTNDAENILETYGMVGAELEDANGNTLKIAAGKKASISFPVPASLQANAPATIQLWHFDDATARWKENGTAAKTGNTYTAQVDKFSFWNVDMGNTNFINLDYTLINATTNTPLVSASTRIKRANGTYGYGITNNVGFVSGLVPRNEALVLEVVSACNTVIYSQNIGPFAANTGLGNVSLTLPSSQYITFTGTLLNCSAAPVSNGFVSILVNGVGGAFVVPNAGGVFTLTILNCTGSSNVTYNYQGTDNTTSQQSAVIQGTTASNTVNIGNVSACGAAQGVNVYVAGYTTINNSNLAATLWKNAVPISLTSGAASSAVGYSVYATNTDVYVAGVDASRAVVWKNGVPTYLTNGTTNDALSSIFVLGTDVYVAGYENISSGTKSIAKIWKNGIATNLTDGLSKAVANSVFAIGNDVYVAGTDNTNSAFSTAKLWKNGIVTNLNNVSNGGVANSVFVVGNDVYVAGGQTYNNNSIFVATVWKNGVPTSLDNGIYYTSNAQSMFITGNDVYVVGSREGTGINERTLWKNGVPATLPNIGYTTSVFVSGADVYVTGYTYQAGYPVAMFWKNGQVTTLGNGAAYSVFVK